MNPLEFFSNKTKTSDQDVPTIDSLKSDELWKFIERPAGGDNADARIADLKSIWNDAQEAAEKASRGSRKGPENWVLNS